MQLHKKYSPSSYLRRGLLLLLPLLASLAISCQQGRRQAEYTELAGERFHTYYRIKYRGVADYREQVEATFNAFNYALNPFDTTSLMTALNRGYTTKTDSMVRHVWRASQRIAEASGGSYDVTCAPLISAWGFGFDSAKRISEALIDSLRSFVGYQTVSLVGEDLIKQDPRTVIDFSSISKGYCSDLIGEMLTREGVADYMVEIGGEIAFCGKNPHGEAWRIGISKPTDDTLGMQDVELIIALDRPVGGLATSGNYRNYYIQDGKKIAHTIDPRTGYPTQTDVLSATIFAPSCMLADGLATACMTMRSEDVPEFLKQFAGVEYLLIVGGDGAGHYRTLMSEGMRRLVVDTP